MVSQKLESCFLEGIWEGQGEVLGKNVIYNEKTEFKIVRTEPVLLMSLLQTTTLKDDPEKPLHSETGLLKILPKNEGEVAHKAIAQLSHPFGLNEIEVGTFNGNKLEMVADKEHQFQRMMPQDSIPEDAKAKQVTYIRREY